MNELDQPSDKTRLASTHAVAKALGIGYTTLVHWLRVQKAPRPEKVCSLNGREMMLWSGKDIEALRSWMVRHKKRFPGNSAVKLQALIRRHTQEIESEMNAPECKPDALVQIARAVHADLQRRKEKLTPNAVAEIIANALCEQTHGFSPNDELRAALIDAVMPAVVSGLGLLN